MTTNVNAGLHLRPHGFSFLCIKYSLTHFERHLRVLSVGYSIVCERKGKERKSMEGKGKERGGRTCVVRPDETFENNERNRNDNDSN